MKSLVKKILNKLPLFAAILGAGLALVTTMSSFRDNHATAQKHASLYWFAVSGSHAYNSSIPSSDVTYLGKGTFPPAGSPSCGTGAYLCVGGFTEDQVIDGGGNDVSLDGSQTANDNTRRKN